MMDEAVGRRLAEVITPEQLRRVRAMVEAMEKAVKAGDADSYHLLNLEFHDRLVEFSGNRKLTSIYRRLINELSLFRRMNLVDAKLWPISAGEHRAIVKAIAAGDPETAGAAMRQHVMDSKERTLRNNMPQPPKSVGRRAIHA
jgi:DNA-binding GntR family transcriptional regulator